MCIPKRGTIKEIQGIKAILTDGATVLISDLPDAEVGDSIYIYADIALDKIPIENGNKEKLNA